MAQSLSNLAHGPRVATDCESDAGEIDDPVHDSRLDVSVVEPHAGSEMTPNRGWSIPGRQGLRCQSCFRFVSKG